MARLTTTALKSDVMMPSTWTTAKPRTGPEPTWKWKYALISVVSEIVRGGKPIDTHLIRELAAPLVNPDDLGEFVAMVFSDLHHLHEGNIARYRLRLPDFRAWKR